jgi:L,D-peptidoglycan transpeptidase YkuD (ErfK/YbiS/YcfS/YnhG family)
MRRTTAALAAAALLSVLIPLAPASARVAPDVAPAATVAPTAAASGVHAPVGSPVGARLAAAAAVAPAIPGVRRFAIPSSTRQVIVVTASAWSSRVATLTLWRRSGSGWRAVVHWPARLGYSGLVVGTQRKQDTGKTPAGSYTITQAFGRRANPGTTISYTKVTDDHWWVEDRRSVYYNQMRLGSRGGFALRTSGFNSSEHLARMGTQYDYAAVVDFNRPHPVVGRGAGIFLHAFGTGSTGGCVSVSWSHMRQVLQWLNAGDHPRIVIGTRAWLAA